SAGMHRWVWDLHGEPLAGAELDFPISAIPHDTPRVPEGVRALPGDYTVRLTAGGRSMTQPLTLAMDPRVKTPAEGLRAQHDAETRIAALLARTSTALQEVRAVRRQIGSVRQGARSIPPNINQALAALDAKTADMEGASARFGAPPTPAPAGAPGFSRLNTTLTAVYGSVDSADVAPTAQ